MKGLWLLSLVCLVIGLYFLAQEKRQSAPELASVHSGGMGVTSTSSTHGAADGSRESDDMVLGTEDSFANSHGRLSIPALGTQVNPADKVLEEAMTLTDAPEVLDTDSIYNSLNQRDASRTSVNVGRYRDPDDRTPEYTNEAPVDVGEYFEPDNYTPGYANQLPVNVGEYRDPNRAPFELNIGEPSIQRDEGPFIEASF